MAITYKLNTLSGKPVSVIPPCSVNAFQATQSPNIRCPHCMTMGALTPTPASDLALQLQRSGIENLRIGVRTCPNEKCQGIVFVVIGSGGAVALPSEVLDFDPSDMPPSIAASLEEAVKCHAARCYKAAALMVRRVLEELCEDRGAAGDNLKVRIMSLGKTVIVPPQLLEAADHLRLLGNDAAHIQAKAYQEVGEQEARIAIGLAKELLKAVYQYKGLLAELQALQVK